MNGGKGLEGVSSKGRNYYNPFVEIMKNGSRAAAKNDIPMLQARPNALF